MITSWSVALRFLAMLWARHLSSQAGHAVSSEEPSGVRTIIETLYVTTRSDGWHPCASARPQGMKTSNNPTKTAQRRRESLNTGHLDESKVSLSSVKASGSDIAHFRRSSPGRTKRRSCHSSWDRPRDLHTGLSRPRGLG